jgi:hypothetical protein
VLLAAFPPWALVRPTLIRTSTVNIKARLKIRGDQVDCEELQALQARFSSGVTLRDLSNIAHIIAKFTRLPLPSRSAKRSIPLIVDWFKLHWSTVAAWLPLIGLRDQNDWPIDSRRELFDKRMIS